jgi:hypothetical protein
MTRADLLLTVIKNLRSARRSLVGHLPAAALTNIGMARHDFGMYIGLQCSGGPWPPPPSAERMRRCIHRVEEDLGAELARLHAAANQEVDLGALTADIASGIDVLRTRDGVEVTREQVLDRARNVATGIVGNHLHRPPA